MRDRTTNGMVSSPKHDYHVLYPMSASVGHLDLPRYHQTSGCREVIRENHLEAEAAERTCLWVRIRLPVRRCRQTYCC